MELPINEQIFGIIVALTTGLFVGLLYDFLKALSGAFRLSWLGFIFDLLFSLGLAFLLFLMSMTLGEGYHRIYLVVMVFCGVFLYYFLLSKRVLRVFYGIFSIFAHSFSSISVNIKKLFQNRKKPL